MIIHGFMVSTECEPIRVSGDYTPTVGSRAKRCTIWFLMMHNNNTTMIDAHFA